MSILVPTSAEEAVRGRECLRKNARPCWSAKRQCVAVVARLGMVLATIVTAVLLHYSLVRGSEVASLSDGVMISRVSVELLGLLALDAFFLAWGLFSWLGGRGVVLAAVHGALILASVVGVVEACVRGAVSIQTRPSVSLIWELDPHYVDNNSWGMQYPEFPIQREPGEYRFLVLGDSSAWGYSRQPRTSERARFSDMLESRLRKRYPGRSLRVLNAAVPGYSSWQMARALREKYGALRADCLILATNSDWTVENFADKERVLPGAGRRLVLGQLYQLEAYLCLRSFLRERGFALGEERAHHSGGGSTLRVSTADSRLHYLEMINTVAAPQHGCRALVVNMPLNLPDEGMAEVEFSAEAVAAYPVMLQAVCTESGAHYVGADESLRRDYPGTARQAYFMDSVHPSAAGHEYLARLLEERVAQLRLLAP